VKWIKGRSTRTSASNLELPRKDVSPIAIWQDSQARRCTDMNKFPLAARDVLRKAIIARTPLIALVAITTFVTAGTPSCSAEITSIVAFGDSLTDAGRLGRFTDRILWVEELANRLGVPIPKPSNRGGTNYAASGAATENITAAPDMDQQVANYLFLHTPNEQDLFVLWGGHNDLFGGAEPARVAGNLSALVSALYASGARQFLVPTLAPLDMIPRERGGPNEAALAAAASLTNTLLSDELRQLKIASPEIVLYLPDSHAFILNMIADFEALGSAGRYGFENVTDAALLTGGNVTTYMWLDPVHPTSKTHEYIGAYVASFVPEPPSVLLLLGSMSLTIWRNRPAFSLRS
jgi:phospholipase/lecithinase/hemolysin